MVQGGAGSRLKCVNSPHFELTPTVYPTRTFILADASRINLISSVQSSSATLVVQLSYSLYCRVTRQLGRSGDVGFGFLTKLERTKGLEPLTRTFAGALVGSALSGDPATMAVCPSQSYECGHRHPEPQFDWAPTPRRWAIIAALLSLMLRTKLRVPMSFQRILVGN